MKIRLAEIDMDEAPRVRAFLQSHPTMWPRIDSAVPAGWDAEIASALEAIYELSTETGVEIRVAQIKSKLAGLRLYVDIDEASAGSLEVLKSTPTSTRMRSSSAPGSVPERAMEIVDAASKKCEALCERCGAPGTFRNASGWLKIACNAHAGTD